MKPRAAKAINLVLLQVAEGGALFAAARDLDALAVAIPWLCCAVQLAIGRSIKRDLQRLAAGLLLGTAAESLAAGLDAITFTDPAFGSGVAAWVPPTWGMLGLSVPRILSFLRGRTLLSVAVGAAATGLLIAAAIGAGEIAPVRFTSAAFVGASVLIGTALALVVLVGERLERQ